MGKEWSYSLAEGSIQLSASSSSLPIESKMKLDGKVALVTGGAMGLGKGYCKMLLQNGAKVLFTDINEKVSETTLTDFQKEFGVRYVRFCTADVTSQAAMENAFRQVKSSFGQLDIVICNAGIVQQPGHEPSKIIATNLTGTIRCAELAMEHMRKDKGGNGGVIVAVASLAAMIPVPFLRVYCGTKAAILTYTRSLALDPECAASGIRVNALCPGFTKTPMVTEGLSYLAELLEEKGGMLAVEKVTECMYELITDDSNNGAALAISVQGGKFYVKFEEFL